MRLPTQVKSDCFYFFLVSFIFYVTNPQLAFLVHSVVLQSKHLGNCDPSWKSAYLFVTFSLIKGIASAKRATTWNFVNSLATSHSLQSLQFLCSFFLSTGPLIKRIIFSWLHILKS